MASVVRVTKNVLKGYSPAQVKVRNATSNDPWGPSGTEMSEIAALTYNPSDFQDVMGMLDRRLNDKGKNWRHILKALKVLDYCLHEGSEAVVDWARKNVFIVTTLREFIYMDDEGKDQGLSIRVAAKELSKLIQDEELLRSERKDRRNWKSRVNGTEDYRPQNDYPGTSRSRQGRSPTQPRRGEGDDDEEMRRAIELSKRQAEEEERKRRERMGEDNDDELAKALRLSKEEEERRQRQLEQQQSSADLLFDEAFATPQAQQQQQPQYFQQQYQQGTGVDFFGNPIGQANYQQGQQTGYLEGIYAQQTGFPQQQQQQFPQPTGYDQNQFLQAQSPQYLQPQQTAFNTANPYSQGLSVQSPSTFPQSGDNNPYANGLTVQQPQQPLQPTPTGSNNPFAQFSNFNNNASSPVRTGAPTLSMLQQQQQQQQQQQRPSTSYQAQSQPVLSTIHSRPSPPPQPQDPHQARLNALLAAGHDGLDTFGNQGDLRIPAQHTAPGGFVNSQGAGRRPMAPQATGTNPFFQQNQFAPQQTGFGNSLQPGGRLMPAHTGPAGMGGMNGYGGQQQGNPYAQQNQQQASLIDL